MAKYNLYHPIVASCGARPPESRQLQNPLWSVGLTLASSDTPALISRPFPAGGRPRAARTEVQDQNMHLLPPADGLPVPGTRAGALFPPAFLLLFYRFPPSPAQDKCLFAHGDHEIRQDITGTTPGNSPTTNARYKTRSALIACSSRFSRATTALLLALSPPLSCMSPLIFRCLLPQSFPKPSLPSASLLLCSSLLSSSVSSFPHLLLPLLLLSSSSSPPSPPLPVPCSVQALGLLHGHIVSLCVFACVRVCVCVCVC